MLRGRFPDIRSPKREDICYATSNRQRAVREMLAHIQLLLVIGSHNSSNSNRLVDVARAGGIEAHLIEDAGAIEERWLEEVETVLEPKPVAVDREAAWAALFRDKKVAGGKPKLVLLEAPGKPVWGVELSEDEARGALDSLIADS